MAGARKKGTPGQRRRTAAARKKGTSKQRARTEALGAATERAICDDFLAGATLVELEQRHRASRAAVTRTLAAHGIGARDRAKRARPRPDFRTEYAAIGPPPVVSAGTAKPADPLAAADWLVRALEVSASHVVGDSEYEGSETDRRKELREIAKTIATITPQALLHRTRKLIEQDAGERDSVFGGGPETQNAQELAHRRHRPPALRGRPRQH